MGILDSVGVSANEVPNDPFGFGNDYWPVAILNAVAPKSENNPYMPQEYVNAYNGISSTGMQFGTMISYRVLDERFSFLGKSNPNQMPGQLGFGQWFQLPSPPWAQDQVPFDSDSPDGKKLIFNWATLLKALGFGADEMGAADVPDIIGKTCLAKIKPTQDENGYWQFRVYGQKVMPTGGSSEGMEVFSRNGNSGSGMSEMEQALKEEMQNT